MSVLKKYLALLFLGVIGSMSAYAQSATTTTLIPPSSPQAGQTILLTASVIVTSSGSIASPGQVEFCNANDAACIGPALYGVAQVRASTGDATLAIRLPAGTHNIKAVFLGTTSYAMSSTTETITVAPAASLYASSTSLTAAGSDGNYTLSGSVAGFGAASLAGSITVLDTSTGNSSLGSESIENSVQVMSPATEYTTDASGQDIITGDLNNDGIPDIVVSNGETGVISIFLGNGDGTFQSPIVDSVGGEIESVAMGDFNADGDPDLVVTNYSLGEVEILLGNGNGTFKSPEVYTGITQAEYLAVADFNRDGNLDVAVVGDGSVDVLLGNGDGTLQGVTSTTAVSGAYQIAVADFNGDGIPDIAVVSSSETVSVLLGTGTGTFSVQQAPALSADAYYVAVGDFNGDGVPDLAVATFSSVAILLGNGNGAFQTPAYYQLPPGASGNSIAVADFNGDGISDLVVAAFNDDATYLGIGNGTFQSPVTVSSGRTPLYAVAADLNGDGLSDIATLSSGIDINLSAQIADFSVGNISVPIGSAAQTVLASYTGDSSRAASESSTVTLEPATPTTPTITWAPAAITYGTPLSSSQLDATASVPGTFTYSPAAGTVLNVGSQTLSVTFTPTDTVDYTTATAIVSLTVAPSSIEPWVNNQGVGVISPSLISTFAGNGTGSFSGDGGVATSAEIFQPSGVAVDVAGNVYVADTTNSRIREVNASTGIITTIAGDGTAGYSGDGGAATSAELNYPGGVAVDGAGNVYIADTSNNRIREVNASTGIITTIAGDGTAGYSGDGGAATSAELDDPSGVAIDGAGNVYIADSSNNRIREVIATTGTITTIAGDGTAGYSGDGGAATSAEFLTPSGVAVDVAGNVYIADTNNRRIREINASTGIITTIAGDGTAGYSGDGGAATSAELVRPYGVAVDAASNVYIAGGAGDRIREVNASTGIITTIAGDGNFGYSGDGGAATSAELAYPFGTAVDAAGNVYIADYYNNRVRQIGNTGVLNYGGQTQGSISTPQAVTLSNIGNANLTVSSIATDSSGNFTVESGGSCTPSTVLSPDQSCTVDVSFTPTITGTITGTLTINDNGTTTAQTVSLSGTGDPKQTPTITWPPPSEISYGTALTSTQLDATASVPGTFAYLPAAGAILSAGPQTLTVTFTPTDTTDYTTATASVALTVTPLVTSTSISCSSTTVVEGASFTCTGTVTGSDNGGTVTLAQNGSNLGSGSLNSSGQFSITSTATSTPGSYTIVASYSGDTDYAGSSASTTLTVEQAGTFTLLSSSPNPSTYGQSITLSALVSTGGVTPTGSVSFMNGSTSLGSATPSQVTTTNLVEDSDYQYGLWASNGTMPAIAADGPAGANALVVTGTGASYGSYTRSPAISVTPGDTYTLSGYINATSVTAGTPTWTVFGDSNDTIYLQVSQVAGKAGFVSGTFTVPAGITAVQVAAYGDFCTVSDGGQLSWSEPQLEQASQEGPYVVTGTTATTGSGGVATISTSALAPGAYSITASYAGDTNTTASTSAALAQTVDKATPTITLASSSNPSTYGGAVTFTATVSAGATGTVTFENGGVSIGTSTISSGSATLTTSALPAGTNSITAVYGGSTNFSTATSAALTQTVDKATPTITLASSSNPSTYGGAVTFTATVSAGATGTVTFENSGMSIGTGTISSGSTTFTTTTLPVGTNSITAVYGGDTNNISTTSAALSQVVNQASTVTSIESSLNPASFGQSVTFTALVSTGGAVTPTGLVTFKNGSTSLGSATPSQVTTTNLVPDSGLQYGSQYWTINNKLPIVAGAGAAGANAFTYTGTGSAPGYIWNTSSAITVVPGDSYTLSAYVDPTAVVSGELDICAYNTAVTTTYGCAYIGTGPEQRYSTTFTVPAGVTQLVMVCDTNTAVVASGSTASWSDPQLEQASQEGPYVVTGTTATTGSGGVATFSTSSLASGAYSITASYAGDTNTAASTSAALAQTVDEATPTVTLASSLNPSAYGSAVTFTATVSSGATGTVTFERGGTAIGSGTISSGTATLTTTALPAGTDSITAVYSGSTDFNSVTSAALSQVVDKATPTVTLTSSANPSTFGGSVTFTATVSAGATGTVTFENGGTAIGSGTISSGTATLTTTALPAGTDSITAVYTGDSNNNGATSAAMTQTVNKAAVTIAVTSAPDPSVYATAVLFTVTVSPPSGSVEPTGSVSISYNGTTLGTGTLNSSGVATITISSLPVGVDQLTVTYGGDINFY